MNRNMFIRQLPKEKQDAIRNELISFYESTLKGIYSEEEISNMIEDVMDDRIWVLEDGFSYLLDELNI